MTCEYLTNAELLRRYEEATGRMNRRRLPESERTEAFSSGF